MGDFQIAFLFVAYFLWSLYFCNNMIICEDDAEED